MAAETKAQLVARLSAILTSIDTNLASGTSITAAELRQTLTLFKTFGDALLDSILISLGAETVTITNGVYANTDFVGLTLDQIRKRFILRYDSRDLLTQINNITLDASPSVTGTLTWTRPTYNGTAYLLNLENP